MREDEGGLQPIGGRDSQTYALAVEMRATLVSQFGADGANALLRIMTRHGRLHPGPDTAEGAEMINSEEKQVTALRAAPDDVAAMITAALAKD